LGRCNIEDFKYLILDVFFGLGKNENDFDWIEKPVILRLSKEILNKIRCGEG
jgi:hypothetical protein